MAIKVYAYSGCGTCREALKFLAARGVMHDMVAIRETPPTKTELKRMLTAVGDLRKLFNTSGQDYRELNLKEKLPAMTEAEAIDLLSRNGNLVKRPFVLMGKGGLIGFKEEEWRKAF